MKNSLVQSLIIAILAFSLGYIVYLQDMNSNLQFKMDLIATDYSYTEVELTQRIFYLENVLHDSNALNQEVKCLAENIYHEARSESYSGQLAVATVTVNRALSGNFPNTVCGVVYQKNRRGCQFTWVCKGNKAIRNRNAYDKAVGIAKNVLLFGEKHARIGDALFYHADYVSPNWSNEKQYVARIDTHLFYRE